jgi:hypothetical protein
VETYSTHGRDKKCKRKISREMNHLGDLDIDKGIKTEWILNE